MSGRIKWGTSSFYKSSLDVNVESARHHYAELGVVYPISAWALTEALQLQRPNCKICRADTILSVGDAHSRRRSHLYLRRHDVRGGHAHSKQRREQSECQARQSLPSGDESSSPQRKRLGKEGPDHCTLSSICRGNKTHPANDQGEGAGVGVGVGQVAGADVAMSYRRRLPTRSKQVAVWRVLFGPPAMVLPVSRPSAS